MRAHLGMGHIGCGGRGRSDIDSMRGLFKFVSVCDLDGTRAEKTKIECGFQKSTNDWRELIHDTDVEYISICLPPDLNHDVVMEAASLRKPIWVEKPMDWRLDRAVEMVKECEKYGTPIAVGQNYRYSDAAVAINGLLRSGAIGEAFFASIEHSFPE